MPGFEERYRLVYQVLTPFIRQVWRHAAAVLAITGIAAGIAASTYYAPAPVYVAPQPVYVAPVRPVYSAPAAGYWNYCGSAGLYYPLVNFFPECWQLVPAR